MGEIIQAPRKYYPTFRNFSEDSQPNIEVVGDQYLYVVAERRHESRRIVTNDIDELLFYTFDDITHLMASSFASEAQVSSEDFLSVLHRKQLQLLEKLNEAWANRQSLAQLQAAGGEK